MASVGTVVSWTWQPTPLEGQPLDRPFAWALIKLDGADTPLLHAVDAGHVRRDQHRRAGARALGRRAGRRDHRHRLLRARRDEAEPEGERRRPRPGHRCWSSPIGDRDPAHRFASRERVPARARGGQAARRARHAARTARCTSRRKEADPATGQATRRVHRAAGQGHGDDVRDHQHPVRRASASSRRTSRRTCCSTAPTSRSCT